MSCRRGGVGGLWGCGGGHAAGVWAPRCGALGVGGWRRPHADGGGRGGCPQAGALQGWRGCRLHLTHRRTRLPPSFAWRQQRTWRCRRRAYLKQEHGSAHPAVGGVAQTGCFPCLVACSPHTSAIARFHRHQVCRPTPPVAPLRRSPAPPTAGR